MKELINIQAKLKAPKAQRNNFGKYNYRSCEDILEAVKPLLKEENCFLVLTDRIINVGNRNYVEATATLHMPENINISVSGCACEAETKKGMDSSQITGSASSYARKYALNGLFAIDDTKDADATNQHGYQQAPLPKPQMLQQAPAPTPAPAPAPAPNIISSSQLKRLYTLAGKTPKEQIVEILARHGFSSSKDITTFKYEQICQEIQSLTKQG
jgi:hypothetical protein